MRGRLNQIAGQRDGEPPRRRPEGARRLALALSSSSGSEDGGEESGAPTVAGETARAKGAPVAGAGVVSPNNRPRLDSRRGGLARSHRPVPRHGRAFAQLGFGIIKSQCAGGHGSRAGLEKWWDGAARRCWRRCPSFVAGDSANRRCDAGVSAAVSGGSARRAGSAAAARRCWRGCPGWRDRPGWRGCPGWRDRPGWRGRPGWRDRRSPVVTYADETGAEGAGRRFGFVFPARVAEVGRPRRGAAATAVVVDDARHGAHGRRSFIRPEWAVVEAESGLAAALALGFPLVPRRKVAVGGVAGDGASALGHPRERLRGRPHLPGAVADVEGSDAKSCRGRCVGDNFCAAVAEAACALRESSGFFLWSRFASNLEVCEERYAIVDIIVTDQLHSTLSQFVQTLAPARRRRQPARTAFHLSVALSATTQELMQFAL